MSAWKSVFHTEATLQLDFVPLKMISFMIFCQLVILHSKLVDCWGNSTVIQFSVPENHHVLLQCGGSDSPEVEWTHEDRKIPVDRQDHSDPNGDRKRYILGSTGTLLILSLEESDGGEYRCNERLVAELQVLTGREFSVSVGRTLLLPCRGSYRSKQKWFHRIRERGKGELIFTWFRNGTVKPEREGSRLSYQDGALKIQDVQPEDSGGYLCNGNLLARLTVLTAQPTSILQTSKIATSRVLKTAEPKKKEKQESENVLLMVVVVGLGLMIFLLVVVCVLLISMRCRKKKKCGCGDSQSPEHTELQPWKTSSRNQEGAIPDDLPVPEETIHYASLGRKNWRERPSRAPVDQNHQNVIYSAVITRPAAR